MAGHAVSWNPFNLTRVSSAVEKEGQALARVQSQPLSGEKAHYEKQVVSKNEA